VSAGGVQHPRLPRYEIRLSAELRLAGKAVSGMTKNLSMGGLCLEIDRPVPEGTTVQLTLFVVEDDVEAEGAHGLDLTGSVQWIADADRGYTIGVKFSPLSANQSTALGHALKVVTPAQ
jgi:hypothetical protein